MRVLFRFMVASMRPTVWVMNWVLAAASSCSSHVISTIEQPSLAKNCIDKGRAAGFLGG